MKFSYLFSELLHFFRYIACGLMILGTGSFFFSLPHFLSPKIAESNGVHNNEVANTAERDLCNASVDITNVSESDIHASLSHYRCWFIIGQIFHGIGAAPILTLGTKLNTIYFEPANQGFIKY